MNERAAAYGCGVLPGANLVHISELSRASRALAKTRQSATSSLLTERQFVETWHFVLEDGLRSDDVVIRVDGDVVYEGTKISTNPLLGYALSFEASISVGANVRVEVPTRGLASDFRLPDSPGRQLVVAIVDGALELITPEHARGYA